MGKKGFTFLELLITITILIILASAVMPLSQMAVKRSKENDLRQNLRVIRTAIDEYKKASDGGRIKKDAAGSGYPPDLKILAEGAEDLQSPQSGKKIRFLRRVPMDPMNADSALHPDETWGLRSYQSEPDDPKEGDDVFDVYSKSGETAIDGTPYRSW
ncbi:MAG: prepilin-type N-terminal cleavage/methylation domain-containing protein [Deltaproteobacteria bacterium]|nr:prepilin-type N-terminal cleavage/methylation domain-containing protein [Deltaproteobacteria bacterium]